VAKPCIERSQTINWTERREPGPAVFFESAVEVDDANLIQQRYMAVDLIR